MKPAGKICFSSISHPMFGLGGAEIQTYYYAKAFAKLGWKVYFFTIKRDTISAEFDNEGIMIKYYLENDCIISKTLKLFSLLRRNKVDILFYRNTNYFLGLNAVICKLLRVKLVWSTMSDLACGKDGATHQKRTNNKLSGIQGFIKKLKYSIQDILFQYGVNHSYKIIVQNNFQLAKVCDTFGKDAFKLYSSRTVPQIMQLERQKIALFIATMREYKQPELFCQIAESFINGQYQFIMAGDMYNDQEKSQQLYLLIKQSGVNYIGPQPITNIEALLSRARILINTSVAEGFPNTFMQAWAFGVPVVSLNVDTDNIIRDNRLGFYCQNDLTLLKSNINKLMEDDTLWASMSKNAINFFNENLNIEEGVKKLLRALTQ